MGAYAIAGALVVALGMLMVFGVLGLRTGLLTLAIVLVVWQLARGRIYRSDTYVDQRIAARRSRLAAARRRRAAPSQRDSSGDDGT